MTTKPVDVSFSLDRAVLGELLDAQITRLHTQEEDLEKAMKRFKEIREEVGKVHFDKDVIKLDVGGMVFKTSLETLRRRELDGSLLATMFSGDGISVSADEVGQMYLPPSLFFAFSTHTSLFFAFSTHTVKRMVTISSIETAHTSATS
jgi:hypothetical protein